MTIVAVWYDHINRRKQIMCSPSIVEIKDNYTFKILQFKFFILKFTI